MNCWHSGTARPPHRARPTRTRDDADELLIGSNAILTLQPELASGEYRLVLGLYDYISGTRFVGENAATYFMIPVKFP